MNFINKMFMYLNTRFNMRRSRNNHEITRIELGPSTSFQLDEVNYFYKQPCEFKGKIIIETVSTKLVLNYEIM